MASLKRVVSVRQVSKAATSLPLELMQHVFSYLDVKSFYAARKVCRYWQFASTDSVPLARQLRRLPILPTVDAADSNPTELQTLYDEAARTLMMDVKSEREWDEPGSLTKASKMGFHINPRIAATRNGSKTVTLNGRTIALFDTSGEQPVCLAQRPLNDQEAAGNGPWLKTQPNAYNELALSSIGNLLAIAQERTIQIYDMTAEPDSFPVNEYVSSATGHYICGIDFEQNDHVLRVRLSGKGSILYLGTPPSQESEKEGGKATIDHWKSKKGLKHTFLDSSLLTTSPSLDEVEQPARLSGLQLLHRFEEGYLFAGQMHGGGESSHYVLGHVSASAPDNMAAKVQTDSAIILARLESYLSSFDYTLEAGSEFGLWENMPSAHEHHPRFAMDPKNCFIALAERDKKRIRPMPLTQIFVYRTPTKAELQRIWAQKQAEKSGKGWTTLAGFLDKLESQRKVSLCSPKRDSCEEDIRVHAKRSKYTVPRLPLCLTTIQGDVEDLTFRQVDAKTCSISAGTVETTRTWRLEQW